MFKLLFMHCVFRQGIEHSPCWILFHHKSLETSPRNDSLFLNTSFLSSMINFFSKELFKDDMNFLCKLEYLYREY